METGGLPIPLLRELCNLAKQRLHEGISLLMPDAQDHNEERRTELANIWRLEGEVVVDTIRHTLGLKHRSHTVVYKDPLSWPLVADYSVPISHLLAQFKCLFSKVS